MNFSAGRRFLELAQGPSSVALAWHTARSSAPFGVTFEGSARSHERATATTIFCNLSGLVDGEVWRKAKRLFVRRQIVDITAFTSYRTNLSPFTKGCREWDASM